MLYSCMLNGRPADTSFYTFFYPNGVKYNVNSLNKLTDVTGWQYSSSKLLNALAHGQGKTWLPNGKIFIGDFY